MSAQGCAVGLGSSVTLVVVVQRCLMVYMVAARPALAEGKTVLLAIAAGRVVHVWMQTLEMAAYMA